MDLGKVLHELRQELENLDAAIVSLERLQLTGRRRGRPPRWLADLKQTTAEQPAAVRTSRAPSNRGKGE